jgi:hypothetical protein
MLHHHFLERSARIYSLDKHFTRSTKKDGLENRKTTNYAWMKQSLNQCYSAYATPAFSVYAQKDKNSNKQEEAFSQ